MGASTSAGLGGPPDRARPAGSVRLVDPRTRRYVVLGALLIMVLMVALGALR
jgi:hypothetical protein